MCTQPNRPRPVWIQLAIFFVFLQFPFCHAPVSVQVLWRKKTQGSDVSLLKKPSAIHLSHGHQLALDNGLTVEIILRCIANYPVEWVCNNEVIDGHEPRVIEWTQRENHHLILISNLAQIIHSDELERNSCDIRFEMMESGPSYHLFCYSPAELPLSRRLGDISHYACQSSAGCANLFRNIKISPTCITTVNTIPDKIFGTEIFYPFPSAVLVYTASDGVGGTVRAAVEYFSIPTHNFNTEYWEMKTKIPIHFSLAEIEMKDLIIMNKPIPNSRYYTQDTLGMSYDFSRYGFADDPEVIVMLNGSRLNEDHGSGIYEIQCIGYIWNTTGSVNKSAAFVVRHATPPYLEDGAEHELVEYTEGDMNRTLTCNALGDPAPDHVEWTWDNATYPGTPTPGNVLMLPQISSAHHDTVVNCTASNRLGQSVTKSFKVHVTTPISTKTIGVTIVALGAGVLLVITVAVLYIKVWRRGHVVMFLTDEEVDAFRNGRPAGSGYQAPKKLPKSGSAGFELDSFNSGNADELPLECLPYNSEFERAEELFVIDKNDILGRGEYGIVYKACLKSSPDDMHSREIAVKTVPHNARIEYFIALLSEVKIMAHIGHHDHIVNLVAVFSANIKERQLYLGVELCKSSLLDYLRDNAKNCELVTAPEPEAGPLMQGVVTLLHLLQWAYEIASGMQFLAGKRVVHADLAARNVLLTNELHAKVGDFGLARQMVNYVYVKKNPHCYLAPQWMAIESLDKMEFTTKSDVWAYGVTLWEIFTLGSVPYPTMSTDFVEKLRNGERLPKPVIASDLIFSEMEKCWAENPEHRPSFSALMEFFGSLHQQAQLAN